MSAGIWHPVIEQGASFERDIYWDVGDAPIDMTQYSVKMQIRNNAGTILLTATSNPGGMITIDVPNKKAILRIPAAITAAMNFSGIADHDILFVHSSGEPVYRLLEGNVLLSTAVTT